MRDKRGPLLVLSEKQTPLTLPLPVLEAGFVGKINEYAVSASPEAWLAEMHGEPTTPVLLQRTVGILAAH